MILLRVEPWLDARTDSRSGGWRWHDTRG
jgi:hypothetical protein